MTVSTIKARSILSLAGAAIAALILAAPSADKQEPPEELERAGSTGTLLPHVLAAHSRGRPTANYLGRAILTTKEHKDA